ncbi:MAG: hypothetical protein RR497_00130, partial [Oscillospiraceae bacterium]
INGETENYMKRNITFLIMGVLFLLVGAGYIGNQIFGWSFSIFFNGWWTLFLIIPSFIGIVTNKSLGISIGAFVLGIALLLSELNIIPANIDIWAFLVPLIIVSIGITLIVKFFTSHGKKEEFKYQQNKTYEPNATNQEQSYQNSTNDDCRYSDNNPMPSYNGVLSGNEAKNSSKDFRGARISAILGGCEIDLSDAVVLHDCVIYCTAILGGIELKAPKNIKIILDKTSILGGTECTAMCIPEQGIGPTVKFVTTSILGGVEIK